VLHEEGSSCAHPVLVAKTAGEEVEPVTTPEIAAISVELAGFGGVGKSGEGYTDSGISASHPMNCGYRAWK
jgi:hypothetical protein